MKVVMQTMNLSYVFSSCDYIVSFNMMNNRFSPNQMHFVLRLNGYLMFHVKVLKIEYLPKFVE